jgi:hypothetical protein
MPVRPRLWAPGCLNVAPFGHLVNGSGTSPPIALGGLPSGQYLITFNVGDAAGHISNSLGVAFQVF